MRSTGFAGQMGNAPLFIPRSTLLALDPTPQYTFKLRGCAPPFYPPYIAPPRPNTQPLFDVVGATPLQHSPSPLHLLAWERMLVNYPGDLPQLISGILRNGTQLGYKGPAQFILSKNLISADLDDHTIQDKLAADLKAGRVVVASPSPPYICSPLGLVPKHDKGWRRIHHLSHPPGRSVNDHIRPDFAALKYVTLEEIWATIIKTGRGSTIIKRDIQDAFRMIPVAKLQQWLLGFQVGGRYYQETCLPFGLSTSPFLFNIFSEAFHWILESKLRWFNLHHYLDDFIRVIQASPHTPAILHNLREDYVKVTDDLGIPRNDAKNHEGQVAELLGIEHDTTTFEARLSPAKLAKATLLTSQALTRRSLTLLETQSLAGFLSFCAKVVRLGRTFMQNIWDFLASFPTTATRACRRSLPRGVRTDLSWWNTLLPSSMANTCFIVLHGQYSTFIQTRHQSVLVVSTSLPPLYKQIGKIAQRPYILQTHSLSGSRGGNATSTSTHMRCAQCSNHLSAGNLSGGAEW
jgi:Reverse transcriptase (RNA-dependent DNA polymerase)